MRAVHTANDNTYNIVRAGAKGNMHEKETRKDHLVRRQGCSMFFIRRFNGLSKMSNLINWDLFNITALEGSRPASTEALECALTDAYPFGPSFNIALLAKSRCKEGGDGLSGSAGNKDASDGISDDGINICGRPRR